MRNKSKDEAKEAVRNAGMELTDDELELVSGGVRRTVNTNCATAGSREI